MSHDLTSHSNGPRIPPHSGRSGNLQRPLAHTSRWNYRRAKHQLGFNQEWAVLCHVTSPLTPQRTGTQRAVTDGALHLPIMPCGAHVAVLSCGVVLASLNTQLFERLKLLMSSSVWCSSIWIYSPDTRPSPGHMTGCGCCTGTGRRAEWAAGFCPSCWAQTRPDGNNPEHTPATQSMMGKNIESLIRTPLKTTERNCNDI